MTSTYTCKHTTVQIHMLPRISTPFPPDIHIHMRIQIHLHIRTHIYIYTHIHTRMNLYAYTHTKTHANGRMWKLGTRRSAANMIALVCARTGSIERCTQNVTSCLCVRQCFQIPVPKLLLFKDENGRGNSCVQRSTLRRKDSCRRAMPLADFGRHSASIPGVDWDGTGRGSGLLHPVIC